MQSEQRRRQILDDDTEKARFDMGAPGATSAPGNGRDSPQAEDSCEDSWVNSFMGRLAALVRDVSGREK
jgi:hypothetical protein